MHEITSLLATADGVDAAASERLFQQAYRELKRIAHRQLVADHGATLNTTSLVHETYLKLHVEEGRSLQSRAHFFALAARAMRQIVIDHARARIAEKRGGAGLHLVDLENARNVADMRPEGELDPVQLLQLDHALDQLATQEPQLASLVEMRYFAGMSIPEVSTLRGVSERTVNRDWRRAKALLYQSMNAVT